jgi:hypothetical protein
MCSQGLVIGKLFGGFMLQRLENSIKNERKKDSPSLPVIVPKQITKEVSETDLIEYEASLVFLEEMVKWLEIMVPLRKAALGSHLNQVEKRVNELSTNLLENCKKELQTSVEVWGRRPFEDYIHEKGV